MSVETEIALAATKMIVRRVLATGGDFETCRSIANIITATLAEAAAGEGMAAAATFQQITA